MSTADDSDKTKCPTYRHLLHHPLTSNVGQYSLRIAKAIQEPGSILRAEARFKRIPSKAEFYCLNVGTTLAHVLGACEQLEHTVLYLSSFTPSQKMKKGGVTKQAYLLYCIENYIIRSQSMYDRLLRLVDTTFEIYNPRHMISHELLISNLHIQNSPVADSLKKLRKIIKAYYRDRNVIIHERQFLEDGIRELEAYTILSASEGPLMGHPGLQEEIRFLAQAIVKDKTKEFASVNRSSFIVVGELFDHLGTEYERKRQILEAVYGKCELADIPT
jgi:HEPN superfamily protein